MARKDRHTFLMGGEADDSTLESLSRVIRGSVVGLTLMARTSCDQYFSSTLWVGTGRRMDAALVAGPDRRPTHL
jgi:hypothetical protein